MIIDKVKGLLYGGALGDALGAPHEFKFQKDVYTGRLEFPLTYRHRFMPAGKLIVGVVGQITDDTEMTLCILHSLVETKGCIDQNVLIRKYLQWANDPQTIFMGINTRKLLKGVTTVKGYENRYDKMTDREANQSNGCLMRAAILAVAEKMTGDDPLIDCQITNPSQVCQEACRLYLDVVRWALDGYTKEKIKLNLRTRHITNPVIAQCLLESLENKKRVVDGSDKGWIIHGLYCALWSFINYDDYRSAIDAVIRLNGDTDTNACIAGSLLGAFYGFDSIKEDPITNQNMTILINADTKKGNMPRSNIYEINCIEKLIDTLLHDF